MGEDRRLSRKRSKKIRRYHGILGGIQVLGMILYFPLMYVYLEVVFHFYMNLNMKYIPIVLLFSISIGFLMAAITTCFPKKINKILAYVITFISCLLFCIEVVCKAVLQQYYQLLSSAGTAADNSLTDYIDAIFIGIKGNLVGLLLLFLPMIILIILGRKLYRFSQKQIALSGVVLGGGIVFHCFALACVHLPWDGDFTPKMIYATDQNIEDQVEQLGILTMLRLDVKHSMFGVKSELDSDFDDLNVPIVNGDKKDPSINHGAQTPGPNQTENPNSTPTIDTSPNVMDIDFDKIANNSNGEEVQWLSKYFGSLTPTDRNAYTGMFKDYNVIFITAEGFSKYLIDKELTPTLYKLANEGFVFDNYYTPLHFTSTSGGEFQNLTGLYPKNGMPVSMTKTGEEQTNMYFSLANQLNRLGYKSIGFHNNKDMYGRLDSHTNLGYEWIQDGSGFDMERFPGGKKAWPQSDSYMMEQTVDKFMNEDKFHVYYLTVSGHLPYNFTFNNAAIRNKSVVENLAYTDTTKAYIAANQELEKGLTYLLKRLEEAGKLEKTLIVMSADHIPYQNLATLEELSGQNFGGKEIEFLKESDVNFDLYKSALIMWSGSMKEPVKVDKICTQVDILPTISNLLGVEYDSRMLIGSDIFSTASPLVIFSSNSWLTDQGLYNRFSGEFTLAKGVTMTEEEKKEYVSTVKKIVKYKLQASISVINEDYYNIVFGTSGIR